MDDIEGSRFVRELHLRKTVTALDLSENKIGMTESLKSSIPNFQSCSEAFASIFADESCRLRHVNLSWNMIRLHSSCAISRSIALNSSLTHLNISYNSFGLEGGKLLGGSLFENSSLQFLDISSNGIPASACVAIGIGAMHCISLHSLIMDNNPVSH